MNELQRNDFQYASPKADPAEPAMTAHDLMRILWRRLWLVLLIVLTSTATAAYLSRHTPRVWRATAQVLLVQRTSFLASSSQGGAGLPTAESVDTQITLLQSHEVARQAAEKVGTTPETLEAASTITPRKDGDNVIDLAVEADSWQHAVDWANALCQAFVDYKKEVAQRDSKQTLATLRSQTDKARKQMEIADRQLLQFQQIHKLNGVSMVDVGAQKSNALNAYLTQSSLVENLKNEYAAAEAKSVSLNRQLLQANHAIQTSPDVRDEPEVILLQEKLHQLQQQRKQMALRYTAKFPDKLAPLDAEIAATRQSLDSDIRALQSTPSLPEQGTLKAAADSARTDALVAGIKLQKAALELEQLREQTTNLPQISMAADKLARNAAGAHTLYDSLNAATRATQLDKDSVSGNVEVVQWGYAPQQPIRPNPKRDVLIGFGVGICLSLLALLLLEQADRTVRTAAEVRRLVKGPVVAIMPQMTRSQRARFQQGQTSPPLIEAYNTARANLTLALRDVAGMMDSRQVILVTSSIAGEGKSLTASELAQSYARAGRRVILVNADMRGPATAPLLKPVGTVAPGLGNVLMGEATVQEALTATDIPNLSVLYSGTAARNPMDLISRPQMGQAIRALREAADVVVIDSPPAAVVADALLLAPHADCVLFVVGSGLVEEDVVRQTSGALAAAAPRMMAYLVNRAPDAAESYRYYSQHYTAPALTEEPRDYSDSRTMALDALPAGLHHADDRHVENHHADNHSAANQVTGNYTTGSHGVMTEVNPPAVLADGPASHGNVNITGVWYRPPLRVLPEVGTHLVVLEGPYLGEVFLLSPEKPLTVGVLPDNEISLARDRTVSRRHAHIVPEGGGYVVYDDNSTNGTFVNEVRVTRRPLLVGDVVQFGSSRFRYE